MTVSKRPKMLAQKRSPSATQDLARRGEQRAADHLAGLGYRIVARNWRSPETRNELDIIAEDGDCLVFVEVKTARTFNYGDPITWITPRKRAAIARAASSYIAVCEPPNGEFRFDTVTIAASRDGREAPLVHTVAAFLAP